MTTKLCRGCDQFLSLDKFNKKSTTKDGLQFRCRPCDKAYLAKWRQRNLERKRQMDRDYAAANRDRAKAKTRAWVAQNPERKRRSDKAYRDRNKEKAAENGRRWRSENRERVVAVKKRYSAENAEEIKRRTKEWRANNKAKVLASVTMRKMRKRQATPPWLTKEHKLQMRRAYETAQVFSEALGEPFHVDHIVPISSPVVCGLHVPWNLQILRAVENIEKSNRLD